MNNMNQNNGNQGGPQNNFGPGPNQGPRPNQGPPGPAGPPPQAKPASVGFGQFKTKVELTVPFDACGPIIGVQASNILDIRKRSGVKIDFNKTPKGSKEDRVFTIEGSHKQVTTAQRMMSDLLQMANNNE